MRWILPLLPLVLAPLGTDAQEGLRTRRTKEAIIKANTDAKIAKAVGERIDNFCRVFGEFYDELGLDKKSDNKLVARLFNTYEEYETMYRRQSPTDYPPLAYFSPSLNAIVLYNDEADVTLRQTLFHEASHQYLNRYTGEAPRWLNEGLAEYFEGWRMASDGTFLEKRVSIYDLTLLQGALLDDNALAPRDLVSMSWEDFFYFPERYPQYHRYLHYCTAWSLVWFSLEAGTEADRERLVTYLHDLTKKGSGAELEVEDWDDFEERWRAFVLDTSARPVDAMDHVLLGAGYRTNGDYQEAVKEYEAALEKDPETPGALYWLGYCNRKLGYYAKAREWLTKAREAAPEGASAPYQLALVSLAMDDPTGALAFAEEASELSGGKAANFLELVAVCQARCGDKRQALRTARKILKLVETDEEEAYYESLIDEIKDMD